MRRVHRTHSTVFLEGAIALVCFVLLGLVMGLAAAWYWGARGF